MKILIDGYNLLHASDFDSRDELLDFLLAYKTRSRHSITIVFDGTHRGTGTGSKSFRAGLEIVYTPLTVAADDFIEEQLLMVESIERLVVSSDRRIQRAATNENVVFVDSETFLRRLNRVSRKEEVDSRDMDRPRKEKAGGLKRSKLERGREALLKKL